MLRLTLMAAILASGATAPTSSGVESWADTAHGWRLAGVRSASGGWAAVQATENGGRTWHRILRADTNTEIGLISRVSATDGFAFVGSKVRTRRNRYLVTTDNGRHWKRLPPIALGFPIEASGRDASSPKMTLCNDVIAFSASWPGLTVGLRQVAPGPEGELQCNFNLTNAFFVSRNGGVTWLAP